jgi:16S rRNA (guanine527-N7)-methyltransferase
VTQRVDRSGVPDPVGDTAARFAGHGAPADEVPGNACRADTDNPVDTDHPADTDRADWPEIQRAAALLFGDRLPLAQRYAEFLVTEGVVRGILGPREAPRIWGRHLLNCAVVAQMIPSGSSVTDIGSGGGLPGIVLAVARPDLNVTLVESLARRTTFLTEVVDGLGLTRVTVVRGRAEECVGTLDPADIVTARAVAPLDRLAEWCLPLTAVGGRMLAVKGASAGQEIAEHRELIRQIGGAEPTIHECGRGVLGTPVTVVEVVREREGAPVRSRRRGRGRDRR